MALLRARAFWGLWRILPYVTDVLTRRAKPRLSSTVAGRRTYTEEELQAALRDIQSGKLGTRRAAVIYGIPRSTLRNKVCHFFFLFSKYALLNILVEFFASRPGFFCEYCSYCSISNFKMTPILLTHVAYFYWKCYEVSRKILLSVVVFCVIIYTGLSSLPHTGQGIIVRWHGIGNSKGEKNETIAYIDANDSPFFF